jgi:DNA-binding MarR family transcriptional regulator
MGEGGDWVDRVIEEWSAERPDLDLGPVEVVGRLGRAAALSGRLLERNLKRFGLTTASFDLLATLRRAGPPYRLAAGALARSTLKTSGTITARLDALERDGLVRRAPDPDDRRGVLVELTPDGHRRLDDAVTSHLEAQAAMVSGLSATEQSFLAALLARLLDGLDEHQP